MAGPTPGVPINGFVYPFSPAAGLIGNGTIPYDLIINEAYPGIVFLPTEANGQYEVIREVAGSWWFVTNADWVDPPIGQWQQNGAMNPSLPAYAMVLTPTGQIVRYHGAATLAQNVNVVWVEVFEVTDNGNLYTSPVTNTVSNNEPALSLNPTWNVGPGISATGIQLNVTDVSSNGGSYLENLMVSNTPQWAVNKEGVLAYGTVPFGHITGPFVFNSPVTMTAGVTVTGGETVDSLHVTGNEQVDGTLTVNGHSNLDGGLTVAEGESVTGGLTTDSFHDTGDAQIDGTETVTGQLNANGGINTTSINASGTGTFGSILSASALSLTGSGGITYVGATVVNTTNTVVGGAPSFVVSVTIPCQSNTEQWPVRIIILSPVSSGITFTATPSPGGAPLATTVTANSSSVIIGGNTITTASTPVLATYTVAITGGTIPDNYSVIILAERTA